MYDLTKHLVFRQWLRGHSIADLSRLHSLPKKVIQEYIKEFRATEERKSK